MSHICCSSDRKVFINKTPVNLKLEGMYAIIACVNVAKAIGEIKAHNIIDDDDIICEELSQDTMWLEICHIVHKINNDAKAKTSKTKPKKPESKIPVKKIIPTEDILNLDEAPAKPSEAPNGSVNPPAKPEITKEYLVGLLSDLMTEQFDKRLNEHINSIRTTLMNEVIECASQKLQIN